MTIKTTMKKKIRSLRYGVGAALMTGVLMSGGDAFAGANNFSSIAKNITKSVSSLPGLLTGLSYMFGILLGVLGIMKIKDHVENPSQTPLKDGAIRLAAGGGLFALPIIFQAMYETIGKGTTTSTAALKVVSYNVTG